MAFLDSEQELAPPAAPGRGRRDPERPRRRRQQYLVRRLIGVGVAVGFVILVVLAFRGCLEARKERGITNYVTDAGTIMRESEERGKDFFGLLEQGASGAVEYEQRIRLIRGSVQSLLDRAENLDVPGELSSAQGAILLSLRLRRDALDRVAANVRPALAEAEQSDAVEAIVRQMAALYSSDVLYRQVAVPRIQSVLQSEEISAPGLPPGNFMPSDEPSSPQNIEWLDGTEVRTALAQVGGEEIAAGSRGTGLVQVAIDDTVLSPDGVNAVSGSEVAVDVQNQGVAEETGVVVTASIDGEEVGNFTIAQIRPGEQQTARFPLNVPETGAELTLDVVVQPVAGEEVTENNEASYTVVFG